MYFPSKIVVRTSLKKKKKILGIPIVAQGVNYPTSIQEDAVLIPGLAQWIKDPALLQVMM